ncbi:C4-dicarboxylate transporter DctA [Rhodoplanes sp. TEM]|uniref:C4-dicarboxylate transporter DctA n=1 Tax=Rhodoplanes tepidamans TaxID=200616 RepID=A0ABT5J8M5_RHOTP|nr:MULTISPECIES: C4-dicarboxylate transporter DctA [Rhodoplanes]MDC7786009.1 C4-dicarboxylate transporter DctA [Rhodoplanes tepidamans]MDC7984895.1 C4-dicarboxylate transporter DctA [Rhodoplanes sp. TEM]MDQ0357023.1 aerobic C4-dicarboxylate transport protein [Rhodoplanes tepidamans]
MTDVTLTTVHAPATGKNAWYRQLWFYVLLSMILGVAVGHWYPEFGTMMQPFGDGFIRAIRMLIAPIILCTVVLGIAGMGDMAKVGKVAIQALIYFEVLTTIALVLGLLGVNLLQPGAGMNIDVGAIDAGAVKHYVTQAQDHGTVQFLMGLIPNTVFGALADGNILQVLVLSVLFGFSLAALGDSGKPLVHLVEVGSKMLFGAVGIVMWAAPIGAFGAIAFTVGKYGAGSLITLGKLLLGFYAVCLVFVFGVLGLVARWCGFSIVKLIRYLREELLICLATTSSEVVLPRLLDKMERIGCRKSIVGLVVPTGYSFNLDGTCLYLSFAAVFLAQATNTPLTLYHQVGLLLVLLLTSKGAAGVSGAAFVVLAATLSSVGSIPVTSVALILGVHRLLAEGLVPVNYIGSAVATIFIADWDGALDHETLHRELDRGAGN